MKTHLMTKNGSACGRGANARKTDNVWAVDCGLCKKHEVFVLLMEVAVEEKAAAFERQTPREYREPWKRDAMISCRVCGYTMFRMGDRTCYGHYENYHCATDGCNGIESRLTETGMSA